MEQGVWVATPSAVPGRYVATSAEPDDRLRMSDVGKLARRARQRIVRTARFDERPTFPRMLAEHLQSDLEELEVVEESWPPHDLVNVQVGLDAWLAEDGVRHELVGMRNYRHYDFGLTDL